MFFPLERPVYLNKGDVIESVWWRCVTSKVGGAANPCIADPFFSAEGLLHLGPDIAANLSSSQHQRVLDMTAQMTEEGFGHCSFTGACEVECPEEISIANIAEMNARYFKAKVFG